MEDFIARSHALLSARPETARISMVYTHRHTEPAAAVPGERIDATAKPAKVVFKAFCPASGLCYKFKASKANELSRVLAALSPHMFEFGASRKRGIASLLSDTVPEEPTTTATPTATTTASAGSGADSGADSGAGAASKDASTTTGSTSASKIAPGASESATEPKSKSKNKKKKGKKH